MLFQFLLFKFLRSLLALKPDYTILLLGLFFFFPLSFYFVCLFIYCLLVVGRLYPGKKEKAIDVLRKMEIIFLRNLTFR